MDIEAALIEYLSEKFPELHVSADVPNPRPAQMVSVERTGGRADSIVLDHPQLSVMCWAASRSEAAKLAYLVDDAISEWDDDRIPLMERSGLFNFPDSDGSPRYQITLEGVAYR